MKNLILTLALLMTLSPLIAEIPDDRLWERWEDEDVSDAIHQYWIKSHEELQHRKFLADLVQKFYVSGESFLEAGCGSGLVYNALIPNVMSNSNYTGIDITDSMLSIAHQDYPEGVFLKDDLYGLSFGNNTFDIVAAFEVLGHLGSIDKPIQEMLRVASRLVVFTVWSGNKTVVTHEHFKNSTFIHTTFSHSDILNAIKKATDKSHTIHTLSVDGYTTAYVIQF